MAEVGTRRFWASKEDLNWRKKEQRWGGKKVSRFVSGILSGKFYDQNDF